MMRIRYRIIYIILVCLLCYASSRIFHSNEDVVIAGVRTAKSKACTQNHVILSSQGVSQVYVLLRRASVFAVSSAHIQCPLASGLRNRFKPGSPSVKIFTMQNTIDIEQSQWGSLRTRAGIYVIQNKNCSYTRQILYDLINEYLFSNCMTRGVFVFSFLIQLT